MNNKNDLAYSKLYRQWKTMRYCCDNPNHEMYHNYGALGIKYTEEWASFCVFEKWALAHGYIDGLSLQRINKQGDFAPDNCFWSQKNTTHGWSSSSIYSVWRNMHARCQNKNHKSYIDYGGRGIFVTKEWKTFPPFLEWALSHGYKKGLSIDRINNDGNYEPSNCRWISMKQQCNNRRSNIYLTYKGETLSVSQWAEKLHVSRHAIFERLRRNLPIEEVLRAEKHLHRGENHRQNLITFQGITLNQKQWAEKIGISQTTLGRRLKKMSVEDALTTS